MEKVVIYRSQYEAGMDQFLSDNPMLVLGFLALLVLAAVFYFAWTRTNFRDRFQRKSRHHSFYSKKQPWDDR